jgi:hypothetical protein
MSACATVPSGRRELLDFAQSPRVDEFLENPSIIYHAASGIRKARLRKRKLLLLVWEDDDPVAMAVLENLA